MHLVFGLLMYIFQDTRAPGVPYLLAGVASVGALHFTNQLPSESELFEYEKSVLRHEVSALGGEEGGGNRSSLPGCEGENEVCC